VLLKGMLRAGRWEEAQTTMQIVARRYDTALPVTLTVEHGKVAGIVNASDEGASLPWVAPALLDLQVNGFHGHNFNDPGVTVADVRAVVDVLWRGGVGGFCPTITTGPNDLLAHAMRTVAQACDGDPDVNHAVVGIHLEGPYISPVDGPRGAHPLAHVRPPDWDEFLHLQDAAGGRIRMVTVAPEVEGALRFIEQATAAGVVISLGHHCAPTERIVAAVAAGARMCTHWGNGAHALLPRHPNYLWDQLANDSLWASIIADGHHLPPSVVTCMLRAKGLHRTVLVSDALYLAGLPPGRYQSMGLDIEMTASGRIQLTGTPLLAGSSLHLAEGIGNVSRFAGVSLANAVDLAARNPAILLGIENRWGSIAPGRSADLLLFDWDEQECNLHVRSLLMRGRPVFTA